MLVTIIDRGINILTYLCGTNSWRNFKYCQINRRHGLTICKFKRLYWTNTLPQIRPKKTNPLGNNSLWKFVWYWWITFSTQNYILNFLVVWVRLRWIHYFLTIQLRSNSRVSLLWISLKKKTYSGIFRVLDLWNPGINMI